MSSSIVVGLVLGGGLGAANAGASFLLYRAARTRPSPAFEKMVLGGMLVRLVLVLAIVALVIWLVPVDVLAFLISLLAAFVVGLAFEIAYIVRRPAVDASGSAPRSARQRDA